MITNREWLNTLSDEEYNELVDIESSVICSNERCGEYFDRGKNGDETNCVRCQLAWLSQPHETTTDEDLKALGFILDTEETDIENEIILYRKGAQILEINKNETYFYITETEHFSAYNMPTFTFSLYEQVKPIVEKKCREVGWIK